MAQLLLTLDSSVSGQCSVALLADGECLDFQRQELIKSNECILALIDQVLKSNAIRPQELTAIGYGRGPGAFIGIRVAASVAQALAYGWGVPLLGVSCLEAVAAEARRLYSCQQILVTLDARMGQIYCGHYQSQPLQALGAELLINPEHLPAATSDNARMVGNAWGYLAKFPQEALDSWAYDSEPLQPDARMLGLLAALDLDQRLQRAEREDQQPVYLRPAVVR